MNDESDALRRDARAFRLATEQVAAFAESKRAGRGTLARQVMRAIAEELEQEAARLSAEPALMEG